MTNPEETVKVPQGKRVLGFLDGSYWIINEGECRGCLMQERADDMPPHMVPVYQDDDMVVMQDAEFAVPGFYIVSPREHLSSIGDFSPKLSAKVGLITRFVRKGMKDLFGVQFCELYHQERMKNSHYHHWLLPCWDEVMERSGFIPRIFKSKVQKYKDLEPNIVEYLRSFEFGDNDKKILEFNERMKEYLSSKEVMESLSKFNLSTNEKRN